MASFVNSLVAPLSLINAFIVTIAIKKKAEVSQNLLRLEEPGCAAVRQSYRSTDSFFYGSHALSSIAGGCETLYAPKRSAIAGLIFLNLKQDHNPAAILRL